LLYSALVTGATDGIGRATAHPLLARGWLRADAGAMKRRPAAAAQDLYTVGAKVTPVWCGAILQ